MQRAALLFRFGEMPLNLRLAIQAGGHTGWTTNYPLAALGTNEAIAVPEHRCRHDPAKLPLKSGQVGGNRRCQVLHIED